MAETEENAKVGPGVGLKVAPKVDPKVVPEVAPKVGGALVEEHPLFLRPKLHPLFLLVSLFCFVFPGVADIIFTWCSSPNILKGSKSK